MSMLRRLSFFQEMKQSHNAAHPARERHAVCIPCTSMRSPTLSPPLCTPVPNLSTLVRSAVTGGAATLVDLAFIAVAVGLFGIPARTANVPALLAGAAVQFFGNRHY